MKLTRSTKHRRGRFEVDGVFEIGPTRLEIAIVIVVCIIALICLVASPSLVAWLVQL